MAHRMLYGLSNDTESNTDGIKDAIASEGGDVE